MAVVHDVLIAIQGDAMIMHTRWVIALIAATMLLGVAATTAAAGRFQIDNAERGFRIVWTPLSFEAAGATVRCNMTLEGSFVSRSFVKRIATIIGKITSAAINTCAGGVETFLTERLPQNISYSGFSGTLPTITGLVMRVFPQMTIDPEGALPRCLMSPEETEPWIVIGNIGGTGELNTIRSEENSAIGTAGGFLCVFGTRGKFIGTGTASVLGGVTKTLVRLI
jgi:hypothetical protein